MIAREVLWGDRPLLRQGLVPVRLKLKPERRVAAGKNPTDREGIAGVVKRGPGPRHGGDGEVGTGNAGGDPVANGPTPAGLSVKGDPGSGPDRIGGRACHPPHGREAGQSGTRETVRVPEEGFRSHVGERGSDPDRNTNRRTDLSPMFTYSMRNRTSEFTAGDQGVLLAFRSFRSRRSWMSPE